jgi:hypothetical protein
VQATRYSSLAHKYSRVEALFQRAEVVEGGCQLAQGSSSGSQLMVQELTARVQLLQEQLTARQAELAQNASAYEAHIQELQECLRQNSEQHAAHSKKLKDLIIEERQRFAKQAVDGRRVLEAREARIGELEGRLQGGRTAFFAQERARINEGKDWQEWERESASTQGP